MPIESRPTVLERYEYAWISTQAYVGSDSQAAIFMGEQYLAAMIAFGASEANLALVRSEVQRAAANTTPEPTPRQRHLERHIEDADSAPVIEYDADAQLRAARNAQKARKRAERITVGMDSDAGYDIAEGGTYSYIVTMDSRLLIWNEPSDPYEVMAGRTASALDPLSHPVLAYPEVKIVCSGEATFGVIAGRIHGLVLNNRSGHYRPTGRNLAAAREKVSAALQVPVLTIEYFSDSEQWTAA